MNKKNKNGFTLIELIVVIAIISVVITIAIPRLSTYISTAQNVSARAGAKNVYSAIMAYDADNMSSKLPTNYTNEMLEPYLDDNAIIVDAWPKNKNEYYIAYYPSNKPPKFRMFYYDPSVGGNIGIFEFYR